MLNSRDVPATGHLPVQVSTEQPVAGSGDRDHDTIPTPRFLRSSSVGNSFKPKWREEVSRIMELNNNDFKSQNFTLTTFPTPQTFSRREKKIQDWGVLLSKFPWGRYALNKEVEVVNSVYDLKTSCSIQKFLLFLILSYSRKDCIGPEQDFPEFLIQDKGQSRWTKVSESRPIPSRKRDRLLDLRLLPGHWRQWIRTRLFRLVYGCSSEWQHSGVPYEMGWNFIVNEASLYKLRIRGSEKLKIVLELYNLEIHQKKAKPDCHRVKTIVRKKNWATFEVTKLRD